MSKPTLWIINQYTSTPDTGMGGRSFYIGRELVNLGWEVIIVASASHHLLGKPLQLTDWYKIENHNGLKFVWLRMPSYKGAHSKKRIYGWFKFSSTLKKLQLIDLPKPSHILQSSPSPIPFYGARKLAKRYKAKLIFEVRDIWPLSLVQIGNKSPNHPFIKFLQYTEDYAYKHADIVISNLKFAWKHMITRGMEKSKFHWIPNGYSEEEFAKPEPLSPEFIAKFPKDKLIVGYAGTLGLANNLFPLLDAAELLKEHKDIHIVLVGEGKLKQELIDYANSKNLENVSFLNRVTKSQIPSVYKMFDICFMSLVREDVFKYGISPNKLFEYLAAGKPIIYAVDSGEFKPVEEAKCGITVTSGNFNDIAQAVLDFKIQSDSEKATLGSNAHNYAKANYEYYSLSKKMESILLGS